MKYIFYNPILAQTIHNIIVEIWCALSKIIHWTKLLFTSFWGKDHH
uniref:Uncharacterized protein n=1 Tax=Anguilla anguilla TaxID=7936 RepID=A0A0E9VTL8_ANGAN